MRADLLFHAAEMARQGTPFALAVVVRRLPASSSREGDLGLVSASGEFMGWLGGSCTQPVVVREALAALAEGRPRLLVLTPDPESERREGVSVSKMTCHSGGSVEIYIDPILPAPRLAVFGASPIAAALLRLGEAMGYRVEADGAGADRSSASDSSPRFAVVCSMGENDEEAISRALALAPAYLGVVASRKRFAQIRETLLAQGVPSAELDRIRCPAGLRIGGQTPEEIALSVLAEIVEQRRAGESAGTQPEAATRTKSGLQVVAAATALDPVCGMTVDIASARHVAEHDGRNYYFCAAGCRTRFLAAPASFLPSLGIGGGGAR